MVGRLSQKFRYAGHFAEAIGGALGNASHERYVICDWRHEAEKSARGRA
jgi:hypothetical protein